MALGVDALLRKQAYPLGRRRGKLFGQVDVSIAAIRPITPREEQTHV